MEASHSCRYGDFDARAGGGGSGGKSSLTIEPSGSGGHGGFAAGSRRSSGSGGKRSLTDSRSIYSLGADLLCAIFSLLDHFDLVQCSVVCKACYIDPEAVIGCEDGRVRVFDMYSGKCSQIFRVHSGPVTCLALTDDQLIIGGSTFGNIAVVDLTSGERLGFARSQDPTIVLQDYETSMGNSSES